MYQLTGFAGGVAGGGGYGDFLHDLARFAGIFLKVVFEGVADTLGHDPGHFRIAQFAFGLAFELWFRYFDGHDGGQPFAEVLAGDPFFDFFEYAGIVAILLEHPGDGHAEAFDVGAALGGFDVVDVGLDVLDVGGVVLHSDFDLHIVFLCGDVDRGFDEHLLGTVEVSDEFL